MSYMLFAMWYMYRDIPISKAEGYHGLEEGGLFPARWREEWQRTSRDLCCPAVSWERCNYTHHSFPPLSPSPSSSPYSAPSISLTHSLNSRYIDNPYLISGKKFDIRIYILVTSYSPLKAWLYRSGFARFSNTHYSLSSISDQYVHLTNVAIQKTAPDYDPEKGCKWSLQELMRFLTAKHGHQAVKQLRQKMDNLYIKSLQSVQRVMINDKHCFELYGFDVLFDKNLKPWLIEINASPSLTASSPSDYELKFGLLEDMLHILDLEGRMKCREKVIKRVGGFDLMWNDGPVLSDELSLNCGQPLTITANSFLGCHNDREQQLKQLFHLIPQI